MINVGILALQGSVVEHRKCLEQLEGITITEVKDAGALETVDCIILPGGESTTIGKLLREFSILDPLKRRIEHGMPVWGTCAGLILLAKTIVNEDTVHLGLMDISVRRNAYGNQLDSFLDHAVIPEVSDNPIPLVFIRAPWIEFAGKNVDILLRHRDKIVMAREGNMLVTSFHPELTEDLSIHRYFVNMIKK